MTGSDPKTLTLHALRLKGTAQPDAVATYYDLDVADVRRVIEEAWGNDLVEERTGRFPGMRLTESGREAAERLVAAELDASGQRAVVEAAYADFMGPNRHLLEICTAWQLRKVDGISAPNDHDDAEYDAEVIDRLAKIHAEVVPVLETIEGVLPRFAGHRVRLVEALDKLLAGDTDYFTKPMFPSYHSVWFELHEDLLATLGIDRASEKAHE